MEQIIFYSAHTIGFIASLLVIFSFQIKKSSTFALVQFIGCLMFALQYFLLGAIPGAIVNIVGCSMRFVGMLRIKKGRLKGEGKHFLASPYLWLFVAASFAIGILTYENIFSLMPAVSIAVFSCLIWKDDPKTLRVVNTLFCSPLWLIYNISCLSYAGVVTETFNIISAIVSYIRFFVIKKEEK